ncbi:MAG: hypothetical protein FWD90_03950 [Defluviitaleaceae bacterium]|nr:hypothetical protein [Defluviitaleaceae bacterium]
MTGNHDAIHTHNTSRFANLLAALYDYDDDEINIVIELAKLLRGRVEVRQIHE